MKYKASAAFAQLMDSNDPLKDYRSRFFIPPHQGQEAIYLCGHSLGLQPRSARSFVEAEMQAWETLGVKGHFKSENGWMYYHELLTQDLATLVGAQANEVVAMNSLTVNLHLMLVSFYRPTLDRRKILIEDHAFPSDRYAVQSQIKFHNYDPQSDLILMKPRPGEDMIQTEDILSLLEEQGDTLALILLGGVSYFSGQFFDLRAITRAAHAHGCLVGFDLAHAIGNLPLKLHEWEVDFAVWCSYKYLNGGPGCVGGCFVHEKYADEVLPRFAGWWGHEQETRFQMPEQFRATSGAEGWQLSNPPILPLATLRASLEIFAEVGMETLRAKSKLLTGYLEFLLISLNHPQLQVITPSDPSQRGCQLSLRISEALPDLPNQLLAQGLICDWRAPDILRLAPVPLYNSFRDIYAAFEILKGILK